MLLKSSPTPARRAPENIAAVKDLMAMHLPKLASASSAATEEVKLTKAEVRLQSYCFSHTSLSAAATSGSYQHVLIAMHRAIMSALRPLHPSAHAF